MNGLELIKHTAGGGVMTASGTGTVSLVKNGKIEFENATETHVDKCFDVPADPGDEPLYDNYLIVVRSIWGGTGNSGFEPGLNLRFRNATGTVFETKYTYQQIDAKGTDVPGSRVTSTNLGRCGGIMSSSRYSGSQIYVYGPNLGQPTAWRNVAAGSKDGAYIRDIAGTYSLSTQMTGISFYADGNAPITGSLTIYGFTKGQTP